MGISGGPYIVRDSSLVLELDAADKNSYPGSGTTWTDLSGNGNTGTLTNGPTFNSGSGGNIVFDGADDYISTPSSFLSANSLTYQFNIYFSSITIQSTLIGYGDGTPNFTCNSRLASSTDGVPSVGNCRVNLRIYDTTNSINNTIVGTTNLSANTIYNIAIVILPSSYKLYINGVEDALNVIGGLNNGKWVGNGAKAATIATLCTINYNNVLSNYLTGNLYNSLAYNRALSATEILQNYNQLKSRFNL